MEITLTVAVGKLDPQDHRISSLNLGDAGDGFVSPLKYPSGGCQNLTV